MDATTKEERLAILEDCGVIDAKKQEFVRPFRDDEGTTSALPQEGRPSRTTSSSRSVPGAHAISGPAAHIGDYPSSDDDSSSVDSVSSADHRRRHRHQEQEENRQITLRPRQQQQQPYPELFPLEMVHAYAVDEEEQNPMIISVHAKPYHGARRMRRCMVVLTLLFVSVTTALLVLVWKLSRRKEEAEKQELLEAATDDVEWLQDLP